MESRAAGNYHEAGGLGPRGGPFGGPRERGARALPPLESFFDPGVLSMPALRVHPGRLRLPALLLALAAAGLASPAARRSRSRSCPSCGRRLRRSPPAGRELEARRAAVLPAAARRDAAAQRRHRHRLPAAARRRPPRHATKCCSAAPPTSPCRRAPATRPWRAVLAWREAVPGSVEALALSRADAGRAQSRRRGRGAARQAAAPGGAPGAAGNDSPRCRASSAAASDRAATAALIERALQPYADAPDTRVAALVAMGRGWLAVPDQAKALSLCAAGRRGQPGRRRRGPASRSSCCLAVPDAEAIVKARMAASPPPPCGPAPALRAHPGQLAAPDRCPGAGDRPDRRASRPWRRPGSRSARSSSS